MSAQKIRVVLVGLGNMGRNHLRVLRDTPGYELAAVVDPVAAQPNDLGAIPFLRKIDELEKITFDAAVVATPTETHYDIGKKLLAMGKSLLMEKPIASSYQQAHELITIAQKQGTKLAVGHVERFNPAVRKLREVIKEGWLGTPIHFAFTRVGGYPEIMVKGNNVILDLAVHDIDVLRSLVGSVRVEHSMCHATWRPPIFDTAEIFLASASGSSATVHVNWVTPTKIRTVRVTGTRGVCFVDYILQTVELLGGSLLKQMEPSSSSFDFINELYRSSDKIQFGVRKVEPLRAQATQFHAFVTDGEAGELCTGRDALGAVILAERAIEIARAGKHTAAAPAPDKLPTPTDDWV